MQAATFFGPERHYLEAWPPPLSKMENTVNRAIALKEQIDDK